MTPGSDDFAREYEEKAASLRLDVQAAVEREAIETDGVPQPPGEQADPPQEPPAEERLVVSAAEYLAETDPHVNSFWGDGLLVPGGSYLLMGGDTGVGKTIALAGLFVLLAAGAKEFLGFSLPGEPLHVLVLEAEGSRPKFKPRMKAFAQSYGYDLAKLPIYFHKRNAPLQIEGDTLGKMIHQSGAKAVLLDPIGRFHDGNENDATDWRRCVTNPIGEGAREFNASFAFSDHYSKPNENRSGQHKVRGSAAKLQDCGAAMRLEYGRGRGASRIMFVDRVRDGALPDPDRIALRIDVANGHVELDPDSTAEAAPDNPADERRERQRIHKSGKAQELIEKAFDLLEAEKTWDPELGSSLRAIAFAAGLSRGSQPFQDGMAALVNQKAIEPATGSGYIAWRKRR